MGKVWDIIPPRSRPKKQSVAKRKKTHQSFLFFVFLIVVFVVIFAYSASLMPSEKQFNGANTALPQNTNLNQPSPTSTEDDSQLTIKVLNGTGRSEETNKVIEILSQNNLSVTKKENALNLYDQTIVYYGASKAQIATDIATLLSRYEAKSQQFTQESPYDIIIVIGGQ